MDIGSRGHRDNGGSRQKEGTQILPDVVAHSHRWNSQWLKQKHNSSSRVATLSTRLPHSKPLRGLQVVVRSTGMEADLVGAALG